MAKEKNIPVGFLTLVLVLIICALVWFLGPKLTVAGVTPLAKDVVRVSIIIVLLIFWAFLNFRRLSKKAKAAEEAAGENKEEESEVDPKIAEQELTKQETGLITSKVEKSLSILKSASVDGKIGRKVIYQLPWYLVIGPESSGKTSMLLKSGMTFPLAHKLGQNVDEATVLPTSDVEYWFSNNAIFVDAAGRYTVQGKNEVIDASGWKTLLSLIRKNRRRQPLNGIVLAVSLAKVVTLTPEKRMHLARTLKQRLKEAEKQLGLRMPIYIVFTKLDLIAGFTDYFQTLGREERKQVWGMTFPVDDGKGPEPAITHFSKEYELLIEQLNSHLFDFLNKETDIQHRSLIYAFPQQMASIDVLLNDFLTELFRPNRYETRSFLRGVYFSSATQEGEPVDLLSGPLAKSYGVGRQAIPSPPFEKHGYFLNGLFFDLIFGEGNLAGENEIVAKNQKGKKAISFVLCLFALGLITLGWTKSYQINLSNIIKKAQASLKEYPKLAQRVDPVRVNDSNYLSVLPLLNYLRDLPGGYADQQKKPPVSERLGLYQVPIVAKDADALYRNGLERYLRPRLMLRLESQMIANIKNADFLYEALRIYLELAGKGPLEPELIKGWEEADWQQLYGDPRQAKERSELAEHLAVLLDSPFQVRIDVNTELVERVREILNATPVAELAYSFIKRSEAVQSLPEWRPDDAAGAAAARVFTRFSGKPLSDGIPGFFTYNAFYGVFLPQIVASIENFIKESWVLGPDSEIKEGEESVTRIQRGVMGLYLDDYSRNWETMLDDLRIVKFTSLSQATEVINTASGPNSPIRNLLQAVAQETRLAETEEARNANQVARNVATGAAGIAQQEALASSNLRQKQLVEVLSEAIPVGGGETRTAPPGTSVQERFAPLDNYTLGQGNGPAPLDELLMKVTELYRELNRILLANDSSKDALGLVLGGGSNAVKSLRDEIPNIPVPLRNWIRELTQFSSEVTLNDAQKAISAAWTSDVVPLCTDALTGRYPITNAEQANVSLNDFSTLFKPGGKLQEFFNANLRAFVNTSSTPWKWRMADDNKIAVRPDTLRVFERADKIRNAYFSGGSDSPAVTFNMIPEDLDVGSTRVAVSIDGTTVSYAHGPSQPVEVQWPGSGVPSASISFFPETPGQTNTLQFSGPWALFRLLEKATVVQNKDVPDKYLVTFKLRNRTASFTIMAKSVNNPFTTPLLTGFKCPKDIDAKT